MTSSVAKHRPSLPTFSAPVSLASLLLGLLLPIVGLLLPTASG